MSFFRWFPLISHRFSIHFFSISHCRHIYYYFIVSMAKINFVHHLQYEKSFWSQVTKSNIRPKIIIFATTSTIGKMRKNCNITISTIHNCDDDFVPSIFLVHNFPAFIADTRQFDDMYQSPHRSAFQQEIHGKNLFNPSKIPSDIVFVVLKKSLNSYQLNELKWPKTISAIAVLSLSFSSTLSRSKKNLFKCNFN